MNPYIGEIRIMSFTYPPRGWAYCDGSLLSIASNPKLFTLLGTQYGGDGIETFALPDLRGRAPMNQASSNEIGTAGGEARHNLTVSEMPHHTHMVRTATGSPGNHVNGAFLTRSNGDFFAGVGVESHMDEKVVGEAGEGKAHENMQPYLTLGFCIAVDGIFPQRP